MIKNYFKVASRQLIKNKGYSFLNIFGLSLGIACAMLIFLWVNDEFRFNKMHKSYPRLYQVLENQSYEGKTYTFAALPGKFAPAIKQELPEIKYAARADWGSRHLFSVGDKAIYERGHYTEPDFLKMFSFKVTRGDTAAMLKDPSSIVVTDKMAEKFFGKEDPIGKTLKIDNDQVATINGVIEEPPLSSSIKFSWLAAFKIYEDRNQWLQAWGNNGIQSFVELKKGVDPQQVNKKLYNFISKKDTSAIAKPFLFSINDWRLRYKFEEGKQTGGRIEFVRLFMIIAMIIIIIACINFMNLATARSEQRAREVGVRKTMGAARGTLIRQFFSESMLMSFIAMLIAALIVILILPAFNKLVEKKLFFDITNPVIWAGMPLMAFLCGLLAGSYPSLYLSSFNPITVFRGLRVGRNSAIVYVRKGLVVTQFVISIVLIISTIIIYRQLQHVKNRHLGYNKENVLVTELNGDMNKRIPTIYNELMATGVVENAAASNSRVLNLGSSSGDFNWKGKMPNSQLLVTMEWVSPQYIPTMGMELKSGRNFYDDITRDSSNVIINETFAKIIGKKDPVGDIITRDNDRQLTIAGVVKDFVFNDMYRQPEPLILFCDTSNVSRLLIRLKANQDVSKAIAKVESVIKSGEPGYPFEYKFMDAEFDNLFKSEALVGQLSRVFAFLAILISCLGLFGLAAYTAERRTKEIGIRKVLGATISNVIGLLSKDFLRLVAIASVVAFPLAWWMMHKFLQGFAYRINIPWWVFAVAGVLAVAIALFTVSFQAVKAAIANPVKSLRTE
ncbi:MAG TPA: ABC transporter permease [Chitinophagaceae bacterium]|nr:ABC transporter permease [Chitinophagaceae bacterium]